MIPLIQTGSARTLARNDLDRFLKAVELAGGMGLDATGREQVRHMLQEAYGVCGRSGIRFWMLGSKWNVGTGTRVLGLGGAYSNDITLAGSSFPTWATDHIEFREADSSYGTTGIRTVVTPAGFLFYDKTQEFLPWGHDGWPNGTGAEVMGFLGHTSESFYRRVAKHASYSEGVSSTGYLLPPISGRPQAIGFDGTAGRYHDPSGSGSITLPAPIPAAFTGYHLGSSQDVMVARGGTGSTGHEFVDADTAFLAITRVAMTTTVFGRLTEALADIGLATES